MASTQFFTCPKGHQSEESDFCSECGAKIGGAPPAAAATVPPAETPPPPLGAVSGTILCPECGAPNAADDLNFCEVCGHKFGTAVAPKPAPPTVAAPAVTPKVSTWQVTISVDPSLKHADSPEPPADAAPQTVALTQETMLIGRRSTSRAVFPEISLDRDEAVSHRHAILTRQTDGSYTVRDLGSSNGTRLNGRDIPPLRDMPLKDGDDLTLGHWTRLQVKNSEATS